MITSRWNIKRIKNPRPKPWSGPWFSFKNLHTSEQGQANWRFLYSYIGMHDWERVRVRYQKTLAKAFDSGK